MNRWVDHYGLAIIVLGLIALAIAEEAHGFPPSSWYIVGLVCFCLALPRKPKP